MNKAEIGRFDGEYKKIAFNDGDKVSTLLTKAGMTLSDGETINDEDAEVVNVTDEAQDGEIYSVVGNYKQGNEESKEETGNDEEDTKETETEEADEE